MAVSPARSIPALGVIGQLLYGGTVQRQRRVWFSILIAPWVAGFLLWQAGPMLASLALSLTQYDFGYASALAWLLFVIVLGLALLLFRGSAFWVYYAPPVLSHDPHRDG